MTVRHSFATSHRRSSYLHPSSDSKRGILPACPHSNANSEPRPGSDKRYADATNRILSHRSIGCTSSPHTSRALTQVRDSRLRRLPACERNKNMEFAFCICITQTCFAWCRASKKRLHAIEARPECKGLNYLNKGSCIAKSTLGLKS
mgnify:CR=1 FL=1